MDSDKKFIMVECNGLIEIFDSQSDVARMYKFTPQYIHNILNGTTKNRGFMYDGAMVKLPYIYYDENPDLIMRNRVSMTKLKFL